MFLFHDFNADLDMDGENDAFVKDLDPNGDGISHISLIDTQGVLYNGFGVDLDGDGTFDITYTTDTGLDINLDDSGLNEMSYFDSDGDGHSDTFFIDLNGDGNAEFTMTDTDGDGHFDTKDFSVINALDAIADLIDGNADESSFVDVPDESADPFDPDSYDVSDENADPFEPDSYDVSDDERYSEPEIAPSSNESSTTIDLDGDGYQESVALDTNGDGSIDGFAVDSDKDGIMDTFLIDSDGDGEFDINTADEQDDTPENNKATETTDLDGDGYNETVLHDINGDGEYDAAFVDTDKDGFNDTVLFDSDFDGNFDYVGYDYDNDGNIDEVLPFEYQSDDGTERLEPVDSNGGRTHFNAFTDEKIGTKEYIDSDGDGENDIYVHRYDSNGDGVYDTSEQFFDTDGDGEVDAVIKTVLVDTDDDGVYDTYNEYFDDNADGTFDAVRVYDYDNATDTAELVHFYDNIDIESNIFTTESEDYNAFDRPRFDPDNTNPDDVIGNPEESMTYWEFQGNTGRCAIYAQKFIIEQYTGQEVDIEDLVNTAESRGWFSEETGTYIYNGNKLLDLYGVPNEASYNNDITDLRDALDSGKMVIVSVDADEYWGQDSDDVFSPADGVNHAVQVIGIDESDPENPMVILNDSGSQRGCGEMVPVDVFMDAWDDGNNEMIVAG